MIHIAIVEDHEQETQALMNFLTQYASKNCLQFQIAHFRDAIQLIDKYKANYDLIFMDIKLPGLSGMEAAKRIRQIDHGVTLVFVTSMAQYAVEGYSVEAFDYILKPINFYAFQLKLKRILSHVGSGHREGIVIRTAGDTVSLRPRDICYVEVEGHYLNWHTHNKIYRSLGPLKSIGRDLPDSYCAISRWYVVNMQYITAVEGNDVIVNGERLRIGRSYKQRFLQSYAEYMVGGL